MEESKSPQERAADDTVRSLGKAPPLTLLAVAAALFELLCTRVLWNALPDVVDLETLRELRDLGRLPRNLAAVSGIAALIVALFSLLRLAGYAPLRRRLVIAAFSGIFISCVVVATVLPYANQQARLVVFGLAAANILVTLTSLTAVRYRSPRSLRIAIGMLAVTCLLSLLVVGLGLFDAEDGGLLRYVAQLFDRPATDGRRMLLLLRHLGEVAWMAVLLGAAFTIVHGRPSQRNVRYFVAALVLLVVIVVSLWLREEIGHRFRLMVFAAFRFGLFIDTGSLLYAVPVGIGLGGGVIGLASRRTAIRQLGAGLVLWVASGYAPHTPFQLLYLVLGALLLTRSAQALDPTGPWRSRQPWRSLWHRRT